MCHTHTPYIHWNLGFDKNSATKSELICIQSILIFMCVQLPGTWSEPHCSSHKYILLLHLKVTKIISKIYWFAIHLIFLSYKNCFSPGADNNFKHLITSASFFLAWFSAAICDYLWISLLPKCKLLNEWLPCQDCNSWHIYIFNLHVSFYSFIILFISISNTVAEKIKQVKRKRGYNCYYDKRGDNFTALLWLQNDN